MPRAPKPVLRFVRALLGVGQAEREAELYRARTSSGAVSLGAAEVRLLQADGVIGGDARLALALPGTAGWLRRQMLEAEEFASQHRETVPTTDGAQRNLNESPLARLAVARRGEPAFLERHHVEAGERVRKLAERARLSPRVTMSYSGARIASKGPGQASEISDLAADARKAIAKIHAMLPRDCADVVLDVCGLEKGLQLIESERGWPRRSAKLVLRIGLDRLAELWGIGAVALGPEARSRAWMEGARPPLVVKDK